MKGFLKFGGGLAAFGIQIIFLKWFVGGLFGKYWVYFWGYLIIAIFFYWGYHNPEIRFNNNMPQFTGKPGYEILKEKLQDSDF